MIPFQKSGPVAAALALACSVPLAHADQFDLGKREFEAHCASCHGLGAKGDGALAPFLTQKVPDLTLYARSNGGLLPVDRMYRSIAGDLPRLHGGPDMPVWGRAYIVEGHKSGDLMRYDRHDQVDEQAYVRLRITSLLDYLNRLQVK